MGKMGYFLVLPTFVATFVASVAATSALIPSATKLQLPLARLGRLVPRMGSEVVRPLSSPGFRPILPMFGNLCKAEWTCGEPNKT